MTDRLVEIDAVAFRRVFPWVHLFRAFRIAVDFRKIGLGALALAVLAAGNALFTRLPFAPNHDSSSVWPWMVSTGVNRPLDLPREFEADPQGTLVGAFTHWNGPLFPLRSTFEPAAELLKPGRSWSECAYAWTQLLWSLCVWGLFAGAITRMSAVQFAGDGRVSMWSALKFSAENFLSFVSAPLLPVAGIGVLWILCLLAGLFGRIPYAGPLVVGLFWWLAVAAGLIMTLILLGVIVGWPLMYSAISTEGSDGYDGFSRAYGYVYSRPWHYLWFGVVSLTYGSVLLVFVTVVAHLAANLAGWGVSAGMGSDAVATLTAGSPQSLGGPATNGDISSDGPGAWGTLPAGLWLNVAGSLVGGFVVSYFWSAVTIIYFLLRQSDDATDLKEVFMPMEEEVDELLPLVGVADSSQPVVERPAPTEFPDPPRSSSTEDTEFDIRTGPTAKDAKP